MVLERYSEKYSALGNISGEGLSRVLGTPSMDPLRIVIRESVQNSWDARLEDEQPIFRIHLRTLTPDQYAFMNERVFCDVANQSDVGKKLADQLKSGKLRVLEISDFRTSGLGGPTRADVVSTGDELTDFVDFIRNFGSARDTHMGGGTYGYGKSSLYKASCCSAILIHSAAKYCGNQVERLMGCQLSHQYTVSDGADAGHYTGRHWWGRIADDGVIEPAEGEDARQIAAGLGLPERTGGMTGTTIMVLDPCLEDRAEKTALALFEETLLLYFWPKMVGIPESELRMRFELMHDGEQKRVRDPREFAPLACYIDAYERLKKGEGENLRDIRVERPRAHLGRLSLIRTIRRPRTQLTQDEGRPGIFDASHHVALMRPAELVVRYLDGPRIEDENVEYGGVFIADEEVEPIFAKSEPPAHDDWVPESLEKREATFVRVALRNIKREMEEFVGYRRRTQAGEGDSMPLGMIADELGQLVFGTSGKRVGTRKKKKRAKVSKSPAQKKPWRLSRPVPDGLVMSEGAPCARFRFDAKCEGNQGPEIAAEPIVIYEGAASTATADGSIPKVMMWHLDGGQKCPDDRLKLPEGYSGNVYVDVSIPGECALDLRVRATRGDYEGDAES